MNKEKYEKDGYGKIGEEMQCQVCLKTITRTGSRQKYCKDRCDPHPDALVYCDVCGEYKHPSEFYDYRTAYEDAKFLKPCKACKRVDNLKRYHDYK